MGLGRVGVTTVTRETPVINVIMDSTTTVPLVQVRHVSNQDTLKLGHLNKQDTLCSSNH